MKKSYGILDLTTGELVAQQSFVNLALAHQWLVAKYPSLQDTDDNRGHYLGGQCQVPNVTPHPLRIVVLGGC